MYSPVLTVIPLGPSILLLVSSLAPILGRALLNKPSISGGCSFSNTMTLHLLRSAELSWKEGFSVVAPSNMMVPSSTWVRNVSCRRNKVSGTQISWRAKVMQELSVNHAVIVYRQFFVTICIDNVHFGNSIPSLCIMHTSESHGCHKSCHT